MTQLDLQSDDVGLEGSEVKCLNKDLQQAKTVVGPCPLVRHDEGGRLRLIPEGVALLRELGTGPLHCCFCIGGSRCGKSTAGNALVLGSSFEAGGSSASGFETGSTFEPVTAGVDVAAHLLPGGGALVVGDCEGAFHLGGSQHSSRGFGALGLLAYHASTVVLHVSMGGVDERDIEALGFLAACGGDSRLVEGQEAPTSPKADALAAKVPAAAPALVLLVNGSRFDLGDAVARRLLRPTSVDGADSDRVCSRAAIARHFYGTPALEALPTCEHNAYWPRVDALRERILGASEAALSACSQEPCGMPVASGSDLAERLVDLVAALNGDSPGSDGTLAQLQPAPATEQLYRARLMEPLVEDIVRRFSTGVAMESCAGSAASAAVQLATMQSSSGLPIRASHGVKPLPPGQGSIEEALVEFDRRVGELLSNQDDLAAGSSSSSRSSSVARSQVIVEVREKLAERLANVAEAMALARQQGAAQRRLRKVSTPSGSERGDATPPGTPRTKRGFSLLEAGLAEADRGISAGSAGVEEECLDVQMTLGTLRQDVMRLIQKSSEEDRAVAEQAADSDLRAQDALREAKEERRRGLEAHVFNMDNGFSELRASLINEGVCPGETARTINQSLREAREELETGRLQRQEAGNIAARAVETRLDALREQLSRDVGYLDAIRDRFARRLASQAETVGSLVEEERRQRLERHEALRAIFGQLQTSLIGRGGSLRGGHAHEVPAPSASTTPRSVGLSSDTVSSPSATAVIVCSDDWNGR